MRVSWFKTLMAGAVVLVTAAACDDNPVDEGRDEVARLNLDRAFASVAPGDSIILTIGPENRYQAPVAATVTATACDDKVTIGSVTPDDLTVLKRYNVVVRGTNNLGFSCVEVSAGSVVDTVDILVVPPHLLTHTTEGGPGGQVVLERAAGQPEFDDNVSVTVGGTPAFWLRSSASADSIVVVLPRAAAPGETTIEVANLGEGDATLTAPFTITAGEPPADEHEPNDGPGTATVLEFPFELMGTTSGDDPDDFFFYTIEEETTFEIWLEWDNVNGSGDLDLWAVIDEAFTSGICTSLTAGYPEHAECTVAPGNYYLWVQDYTPGPETGWHIYTEIH